MTKLTSVAVLKETKEKIKELAWEQRTSQHQILADIVEEYFNNRRK